MVYKFHTDKRTRARMSRVHSTNGKDEVALEKMLWHKGIRYRKNYKKLPGKPDIAITKYKIAIFIDGEFWHGYDWNNYKTHIKSNRDYWIKKIEYNMQHDQKVNEQLRNQDWTVLRFWSKRVLKNLEYYCSIVQWYVDSKR
ncbi:very short patch repair endonuclease [Liquorilactobacillus sicerae]|uniref:very short patch repair endonuclease n=1 Tax=Liquorilactobacillus sicerae TaxID=1416943 RepID=UPI00247FE2A1|nr:very short patch repair endonuclease [Liquorilactobacillus sicerae]